MKIAGPYLSEFTRIYLEARRKDGDPELYRLLLDAQAKTPGRFDLYILTLVESCSAVMRALKTEMSYDNLADIACQSVVTVSENGRLTFSIRVGNCASIRIKAVLG